MAAREELVSIALRRAAAEALAALATFGLGVNDGLSRVTAPGTAERGLDELARAIGRKGAKVTVTMAWIEADVVARMADDGLKVLDALQRREGRIPGLAGDVDQAAAREGLEALRAAL